MEGIPSTLWPQSNVSHPCVCQVLFATLCALGFPVGVQLIHFDSCCVEFSKSVLTDEVKMLERSDGGRYVEKNNLRQKTILIFFTYL